MLKAVLDAELAEARSELVFQGQTRFAYGELLVAGSQL